MKKVIKYVPVVVAAAFAVFQALGEQKREEKFSLLEERITSLENKESE